MRSIPVSLCILAVSLASLASPAAAGDAPYATSFETDAPSAMPAGWTDISATPFVTGAQARTGDQSFYEEATGGTTEARYAWTPGVNTPWKLSFSLMISGNSTQATGHTVAFGLYGADTWGATGVYVGWDDVDSHWELRGAGDDPPPVIQPDAWYDLEAEFNGGDVMMGQAVWYLDGEKLGAGDLASIQGTDTFLQFATAADSGSAYGFVDDINIRVVPEPGCLTLLLCGLAVARRRRK